MDNDGAFKTKSSTAPADGAVANPVRSQTVKKRPSEDAKLLSTALVGMLLILPLAGVNAIFMGAFPPSEGRGDGWEIFLGVWAILVVPAAFVITLVLLLRHRRGHKRSRPLASCRRIGLVGLTALSAPLVGSLIFYETLMLTGASSYTSQTLPAAFSVTIPIGSLLAGLVFSLYLFHRKDGGYGPNALIIPLSGALVNPIGVIAAWAGDFSPEGILLGAFFPAIGISLLFTLHVLMVLAPRAMRDDAR